MSGGAQAPQPLQIVSKRLVVGWKPGEERSRVDSYLHSQVTVDEQAALLQPDGHNLFR